MASENRHHYLLLVHNLTAAQHLALTYTIQNSNPDDEWFNYTGDAWLVCTTSGPEEYGNKILAILKNSSAYFLLLSFPYAQVSGGLLPEEAWKWLRRHNILPP